MAHNEYKPKLLQKPFILFIFVYICFLIALVEYSRRSLPLLRESPPRPGETVPAGNIPLATAAGSFGDPGLRIPHPPTTQFDGIDVPAFSTARWGLSVVGGATHWPPVLGSDGRYTMNQDGFKYPQVKLEDPYTKGLCIKPVVTMGFTDNPDDCNALVEGTLVSGQLQYQVHLLDDDCYSKAAEFDLLLHSQFGVTLTPDCWTQEELSATTFTNVQNEYPGKNVLIRSPSGGGGYEVTYVDTSTKGGWPLHLNGGSSCWQIFTTPYLPVLLPEDLTAYDLWGPQSQFLYCSQWIGSTDWAEKHIIRVYMTEKPPYPCDPYGRRIGVQHAGCTKETVVTSSSAPSLPSSSPAQTVPIFSTPSLPAPSTFLSHVSKGPSTESSSRTVVDDSGTQTVVQTQRKTTSPPQTRSAAPSLRFVSPVKTSKSIGASLNTPVQSPSVDVQTAKPHDETIRKATVKETTTDVDTRQGFPSVPPLHAESGVSDNPDQSSGIQPIPGLWASRFGSTAATSTQQSLLASPASIDTSNSAFKGFSVQLLPISKSSRTNTGIETQSNPLTSPLLVSDRIPTTQPRPADSMTPESTRYVTRPDGAIVVILPAPTPPPLGPPPKNFTEPPIINPFIRQMSPLEYFFGMFGPVILGTILSILVQLLGATLCAIMPFVILSSSSKSGISAPNSVCLVLGGIKGPWTSTRLLWRLGESLPLLVEILLFFSNVLTAISTSTVSLGYFGLCETGSHDGWCYMGVGYYGLVLWVAEGVLIAMALSLGVVGILLAKRSKIYMVSDAKPWSVGHVASLAVSVDEQRECDRVCGLLDLLRDMRQPARDEYIPRKVMMKYLEGYTFELVRYEQDGVVKYGILAYAKDGIIAMSSSERSSSGVKASCRNETHELRTMVRHVKEDDGTLPVRAHYARSITPSVMSYHTGRTSVRPLLRDCASQLARRSFDTVKSLHSHLECDLGTMRMGVDSLPTLGLTLPHIEPPTTSSWMEEKVTTKADIDGSEPQAWSRFSVQTFETQSYHPSIADSIAPIWSRHRTDSFHSGSVSIMTSSESRTITPQQSFDGMSPQEQTTTTQATTPASATTWATPITQSTPKTEYQYKKHRPISLHSAFQVLFLFLLTALFVLITYYECVEIDPLQPGPPSAAASFEIFMDSQSIGVSILFTSLAVSISLFWDYFFSHTVPNTVSFIFYHDHDNDAGQMSTAPPITVFDGFTSTLRRLLKTMVPQRTLSLQPQIMDIKNGQDIGGHTQTTPSPECQCKRQKVVNDIKILVVSLAGILSKTILPMLMAHVPFRQYQTWELHLVTGWTTVTVLGYMVLVLGGCLAHRSFLTQRKGQHHYLPVVPDCLAAVMYLWYYDREVSGIGQGTIGCRGG